MSTYHQMGHDSWNLISEAELGEFGGLILSPVNDSPADVTAKVRAIREKKPELDVILDPQFYKPQSEKGKLGEWAHFDGVVDTTDLSDLNWWRVKCEKLKEEALRIGATSIASPAVIPRTYDSAYYDHAVQCADMLADLIASSDLAVVLTVIVRLPELGAPNAAEQIASIVTRTDIGRIYLVFFDDTQPRQQYADAPALAGAMRLIGLLESAGSSVLTAFCGLEVLLWKTAGATDAATGKFFNLRRFAPGRWAESTEGGRQYPYWLDQDYLTLFRENDMQLLLREGLIDRVSAAKNPYSVKILEILDANLGTAWVGLGWRQYMSWFREIEDGLTTGISSAADVLRSADAKWADLDRMGILLFERGNTGAWIRPWLNALTLNGRP